MHHVIAIVGPTAVGKTQLAIALANDLHAEIVGADASQVYRGLDIGTGKATPSELVGIPHHLINVADPDAPLDAMSYARMADAAIESIVQRGHRVIVCGGTGLYLRALFEGLSEAPPASPEVQTALRARIAAGELPALRAELAAVDAKSASRIQANDPQRTERALGVFLTTGKSLSDWHAEHQPTPRYRVTWVGLEMPRPKLTAGIEARVAAMFRAGFVQEVERLLAAGYGPSLRSLGALGYRYIAAALAGEMSMADAQQKTVIASRRYAKRQMTWFKRVDDVRWFGSPVDPTEVATYVRAAEQATAAAPEPGEKQTPKRATE